MSIGRAINAFCCAKSAKRRIDQQNRRKWLKRAKEWLTGARIEWAIVCEIRKRPHSLKRGGEIVLSLIY
jgi:hypothetical protein